MIIVRKTRVEVLYREFPRRCKKEDGNGARGCRKEGSEMEGIERRKGRMDGRGQEGLRTSES